MGKKVEGGASGLTPRVAQKTRGRAILPALDIRSSVVSGAGAAATAATPRVPLTLKAPPIKRGPEEKPLKYWLNYASTAYSAAMTTLSPHRGTSKKPGPFNKFAKTADGIVYADLAKINSLISDSKMYIFYMQEYLEGVLVSLYKIDENPLPAGIPLEKFMDNVDWRLESALETIAVLKGIISEYSSTVTPEERAWAEKGAQVIEDLEYIVTRFRSELKNPEMHPQFFSGGYQLPKVDKRIQRQYIRDESEQQKQMDKLAKSYLPRVREAAKKEYLKKYPEERDRLKVVVLKYLKQSTLSEDIDEDVDIQYMIDVQAQINENIRILRKASGANAVDLRLAIGSLAEVVQEELAKNPRLFGVSHLFGANPKSPLKEYFKSPDVEAHLNKMARDKLPFKIDGEAVTLLIETRKEHLRIAAEAKARAEAEAEAEANAEAEAAELDKPEAPAAIRVPPLESPTGMGTPVTDPLPVTPQSPLTPQTPDTRTRLPKISRGGEAAGGVSPLRRTPKPR